jgi:transcriptional regulator with XRE-family HTH domain
MAGSPKFKKLGSMVREHRERLRLSQRDVAEQIGVFTEWYAMLEAGQPICAKRTTVASLTALLELPESDPLGIIHSAEHLNGSTPAQSAFRSLPSIEGLLETLSRCHDDVTRLRALQAAACAHFPESSMIATALRRSDCTWRFQDPIVRGAARTMYEKQFAYFADWYEGSDADDLMLYPQISRAGTGYDLTDYDLIHMAALLKDAYPQFAAVYQGSYMVRLMLPAGSAGTLFFGDLTMYGKAGRDFARLLGMLIS